MSVTVHVASVSLTVRYVVVPMDGEYAVYRSNRRRDGRWYLDLSSSSGRTMRLITAIQAADMAARAERDAAVGRTAQTATVGSAP